MKSERGTVVGRAQAQEEEEKKDEKQSRGKSLHPQNSHLMHLHFENTEIAEKGKNMKV